MKALIVLSLLLGGCSALPVNPTIAPAPLQKTVIDDVALKTLWQVFDVTLDGIKLLREAGVLVVGSPKALKVANGIDHTAIALNAAEMAIAAGSTVSYGVALTAAMAAIAELKLALGSR